MIQNYQEQMSLMNDVELVKIVLSKDNYQPEAAQAAIDEALKRGLITKKLIPIKSIMEIIEKEPELEEERKTESFIQSSNLLALIIVGIVLFILAVVACAISKEITGRANFTTITGTMLVIFFVIRYLIKGKSTNQSKSIEKEE